MEGAMDPFDPFHIVWVILILASCIHVFVDSKRDPRIGSPWLHAWMCAIVVWPLPYILWLFWWPGKLRHAIFGSGKRRTTRWGAPLSTGHPAPPPANGSLRSPSEAGRSAKMKTIRDSVFYAGGFVGWLFIFWIGGCAVLGGFPWREHEMNRTTSQDGTYDAVTVRHETPPLTSGRASVCIVPAGKPFNGKQTVFVAYDLHWSKVKWTAARELTITHPAFDPVLHYEPIWPRYPRFTRSSDMIRIVLVIDHEMDSLNKAAEGLTPNVANQAPQATGAEAVPEPKR